MEQPVIEGDVKTETIVGTGSKGDKIVKVDGFIIFIETDKKEGESITFEVTKVMEKVGFGQEQ